MLCCEDFLKQNGADFLAHGIHAIQIYDAGCRIEYKCSKNCDKGDYTGSDKRNGYMDYHEKWFVSDVVTVTMCTDSDGKLTSNDPKTTLYHELIHGLDSCKRKKRFGCGAFTIESLNKGDWDNTICTEIHAYAKQNNWNKSEPLTVKQIQEYAAASVRSACKFSQQEPSEVDDNFNVVFEKRIASLFNKCIDWLD